MALRELAGVPDAAAHGHIANTKVGRNLGGDGGGRVTETISVTLLAVLIARVTLTRLVALHHAAVLLEQPGIDRGAQRKAPARRQGFSGGPGKAEGEMPGSASGHIAAVGRPFHVERGERASKLGTGGMLERMVPVPGNLQRWRRDHGGQGGAGAKSLPARDAGDVAGSKALPSI
jgi:hypothetical protein